MRLYPLIAVFLCTLGCSEPRVDLHLVRSASSPIKSEVVAPTPCEHCVSRSWVAHDGTSIDLQVERDPYLSIPAHRISQAEIVHGRSLYRPYCDGYVLSLRLGIPLDKMTRAIENVGDLPSVVIVEGLAVDAGRDIFTGETLTLAFSDRSRAVEVAELVGASPSFREEDDSWRAGARQQRLAILNRVFDSPEELRHLAKEHGLQAEDLKKEDLAARLFCP